MQTFERTGLELQCTVLYHQGRRKSYRCICTYKCRYSHMVAYICANINSKGKYLTSVRNREVTSPVSHTISLLSTKSKH